MSAQSWYRQNARDFLGLSTEAGWKGSLVVDDVSGYKACFDLGVSEVGCIAHARRKFHELWANHQSKVGEQAMKLFQALYDVERDAADLDIEERRALRQDKAKPVADALKQWLNEQRQQVPDGSATANHLDRALMLRGWLAEFQVKRNEFQTQRKPTVAALRPHRKMAGSPASPVTVLRPIRKVQN